MAANGKYGHRIVWSIAVLVLFLAIGLVAITAVGTAEARAGRMDASFREPSDFRGGGLRAGKLEASRGPVAPVVEDEGRRPEVCCASTRGRRPGWNAMAMAAAVYDRIGTARFEPEDFFLLGLTFARAGNLERAFEIWNKATQSGPDHPEMLDHLARLAARMQRLDEAAVAARKLERQPGWEARGLLVLGEIQQLLKNPKGAVDAIRKGLELDPSAKGLPVGPDHFRKLLARSWLEIGQPNRAIETLSAEPGKHGPALADPEASWLLSRAYLQNGQTADASAALKRSGTYRDENPLMPEPSPYTGASRCASCHPKETRTHDRSRHSRTLAPRSSTPRSTVPRQTVGRPRRPQGHPHFQARSENESRWRPARAIASSKRSSSTPSASVSVTSR